MIAEVMDHPLQSELWPQVEKGIVIALSADTANCGLDDVIERIRLQELQVIVVLDEDVVFGVAVIEQDNGWIDLPMLWSAGLESLNALFDCVEDAARALGAKGVKWATGNDKGEIYAAKRGYRRRLVEYVKEI